jgi:hypothetical protein
MGGYGSTRWNSHSKRYAVEDGFVLPMKVILSSRVWRYQGTLTWSRNREKIGSIGYRVDMDQGIPSSINLIYTWNGKDMDYIVRFSRSPLPWGGDRYWFSCPYTNCQRRVAKLYLPPGSPYFACRSCHKLTYRSCQEKGESNRFFREIAQIMQDVYPGITAKDYQALLEDKYTKHMRQILLEKYIRDLENMPDPYAHYLTVDELCQQSGLSVEGFAQLSAVNLLVPDHEGKYRPRLLKWAQKLAYLLHQGWKSDEIKRWAKGRFHTEDPKYWPPDRARWQA